MSLQESNVLRLKLSFDPACNAHFRPSRHGELIAKTILLCSYISPPKGFGRALFRVGKVFGEAGRVAALVFLLAVAIAAVLEPRTLLLSFVASYPVVGSIALAELVSAGLMFTGNWYASRDRRVHSPEA